MEKKSLALGALLLAGIGAAVYFGGKGEEGEILEEEEEVRVKKMVTTPGEMISRVQTEAAGLTPAQSTAHKIMSGLGFAMVGIPVTQPVTQTTHRGTTARGLSKKESVIYGGYKPTGEPYVFGGKAFETQAAKEVVQHGYSPTLGAAFGISPEISGGYRGSGMTQSEYKSLTAHRTYSSPATAKKTSTDASKAISHAKRLRAGRGD